MASINMLAALGEQKVKVSPKLKNLIRTGDKLTVVVLKSDEVFVFQYSTSPPPRYDQMKTLKLITGGKIEGALLEKVQKLINDRKSKKTVIKTTQGKLFV